MGRFTVECIKFTRAEKNGVIAFSLCPEFEHDGIVIANSETSPANVVVSARRPYDSLTFLLFGGFRIRGRAAVILPGYELIVTQERDDLPALNGKVIEIAIPGLLIRNK